MPQGWPGRSTYKTMATLKGRYFVGDTLGLWEIDTGAKLLRAWGTCQPLLHAPGPHPFQRFPSTSQLPHQFPQYCTTRVELIGHDGARLYMRMLLEWRGVGDALVCYDVDRGTWYGPVSVKPGAKPDDIGDGPGIWTADGYVATSDVVDAARKAKLASTTAQLLAKREQFHNKAPPLDRAKYAFGLREFDKASRILHAVLKKQPTSPDALLLMGMVHDRLALNRPHEALAYYSRAAALRDDPRVAAAGLYHKYVLYLQTGQRPEALRVGKELLDRFELYRPYRQAIAARNATLTDHSKDRKGR